MNTRFAALSLVVVAVIAATASARDVGPRANDRATERLVAPVEPVLALEEFSVAEPLAFISLWDLPAATPVTAVNGSAAGEVQLAKLIFKPLILWFKPVIFEQIKEKANGKDKEKKKKEKKKKQKKKPASPNKVKKKKKK